MGVEKWRATPLNKRFSLDPEQPGMPPTNSGYANSLDEAMAPYLAYEWVFEHNGTRVESRDAFSKLAEAADRPRPGEFVARGRSALAEVLIQSE